MKPAIVEIFQEFDRSSLGRATTRVVTGMADRLFGHAQDLVDEERELAEKFQRDGQRTTADTDRLREIEAERDRLRAELEKTNAALAAQEFRDRSQEVDSHELDGDEVSANVGLLAAKKCPNCGETMQIVQGGLNIKTHRRNFYWRCTAIRRYPCPNISFRPEQDRASIVRPESSDFDTPIKIRHSTWDKPEVIQKTHARVRQHLEEDDKQLICPKHLLPHGSLIFLAVKSTTYIFNSQFFTIISDWRAS